MNRRWQHPASVLAAYILLAVGLTHPLLLHLSNAVPSDIGDPLLNTWILTWDAHALLTDPFNLFNANIFYPLPNTLAFSEHLFNTALLALPLQLVTAEPVVAYNLSLLASFPLAAFGMYLLALHWTGRRSAAFIAGLIFGFAPYRFAAIAHVQLLTFQWLPLALLFLDKIFSTLNSPPAARYSSLRFYAAFGLFFGLQLLASWYLAIYTSLIIGLFFLGRWLTRRNRSRTWAGLLASMALVLLLVLPFARPYLQILPQLQSARPPALALGLAAAPADYLAAAPYNRLFGPLTQPFRTRPGFTEENWLFLGLLAPVLALLALGFNLRRKPALQPTPYLLCLILFISLTLTFPGPYAALARLLPVSTVVRVPPRWVIPALFALAGLAAFSLATIRQIVPNRRWPLVMVPLVVALLLESLSAPIPLADVTPRTALNPAYRWLASQPGKIALVELPLHVAPAPEFPEVKRMQASTLGWWGLVNGYSGYTPPRQPVLATALATFPDESSVTALQHLLAGIHKSPLATSGTQLFVLVHPDEAPLDRRRWDDAGRWQAEASPALWPVGRFEGDDLYEVLPADPARFAGEPLALFGPDSHIQLLDAVLAANPPRLALYWRITAPPPDDLTVFVHLRAADGFVRSQTDGPPVGGHRPTSGWTPGQVVQDIHPLPPAEDYDLVDYLAVGLYQSATGERLPAATAGGVPLPENAVILPLR